MQEAGQGVRYGKQVYIWGRPGARLPYLTGLLHPGQQWLGEGPGQDHHRWIVASPPTCAAAMGMEGVAARPFCGQMGTKLWGLTHGWGWGQDAKARWRLVPD